MNKHPANALKAARIVGGVATDQKHDSAHKHVTGTAVYIDDIPEPEGTLHIGSAIRPLHMVHSSRLICRQCAPLPA